MDRDNKLSLPANTKRRAKKTASKPRRGAPDMHTAYLQKYIDSGKQVAIMIDGTSKPTVGSILSMDKYWLLIEEHGDAGEKIETLISKSCIAKIADYGKLHSMLSEDTLKNAPPVLASASE